MKAKRRSDDELVGDIFDAALEQYLAQHPSAIGLVMEELAKFPDLQDICKRSDLPDALRDFLRAYAGWQTVEPYIWLLPDKLDELDKPLAAVIEILGDPLNYHRLAVTLALKGRRGPTAINRSLDDLVRKLTEIRAAAVDAQVRRPRNRPKNPGALRAGIDELARYWTETLGFPFTQDWKNDPTAKDRDKDGKLLRQPLTPATAFCYAVVKVVCYDRLRELPRVTRQLVDEIRSAAGMSRGRPARRPPAKREP